jgi:hypothetical protein
MTIEQILQKLIEASSTCPKNDEGFIPASKLGMELTKLGFDYHELGYKKLGDLLRELNSHLEISTSIFPSGLPYIRFKDSVGNVLNINPDATTTQSVKLELTVQKKVWVENFELDDWGIIFDCNTKMKRLQEIALEEPWYYGSIDNGSYPSNGWIMKVK